MRKVLPYIMGMAVLAAFVVCAVSKWEEPIAMAGNWENVDYLPYYSGTWSDATGAGQSVWTTVTDERFGVHTMHISTSTAMNVQVVDGSDTIFTYYFSANGGVAGGDLDFRSDTKGNDLKVIASEIGTVSVLVTGKKLWE